ncbi:MAG TPA: ergothioneine biosynthesis protein EgtB [Burkholderiales bacterium]|nr:ergothioneine biosynthesis protein EgtB [Burkholderiales bacterium]
MSELPNRELPRSDLAARYREIRAQSEQICAPLAVDDYQVQSVVDASPPKWHLAHVSWFFETFLLQPFSRAYEPFHPRFGHLFNSYYNGIGAFHPRPERHALSRPTVEEIYRYRVHVNEHMLALIAGASGKAWPDIAERVVLGLNHEQQHQELLLMDIKRNFLANPLFPAYAEQTAPAARPTYHRWIAFAGGLKEIGHEGKGFYFDNETPRHKVFLRDYWLGSRLITNGEYLEFIDDGGYARPELWLSDGWRSVGEQHWEAPLYWRKLEGEWREMTLHGMGALDRGAPVCHVSYYEADAFARWREARLPMEAELEAALSESPIEGNFLESGLFHPRGAVNGHGRQWFGDLWEWTTSAYSPYPGFKPMPGALGEYNGKFMANQLVLRGGSCATPKSHIRATYRNFFYPHDRWPFTGIRLARDGSD